MNEDIPQWVKIEYATICLKSKIDEDEILSTFEELSELQFPEELDNKIQDINEEDPADSSISAADRPPRRTFDSDLNLIIIDVVKEADDYRFHIHANFEWRIADKILDLLGEILPMRDEFEIENFQIDATIDRGFNSLTLPITGDSESNVVGIRMRENGSTYILQSQSEDGTTSLRHTQTVPDIISLDDTDFAESKILTIVEFLEPIVQP